MRLHGRGKAAIVVFVVVLILDQLSKWQINSHIPLIGSQYGSYPYGGIGVFENFFGIEFSISHVINYGAAWGVFADAQVYLLGLRIVLILGMFTYGLFFNTNEKWVLPIALILAGAVGNVLDFFVYGHVVDMLNFYFWGYDYPVFNLADSAVFLGVVWLSLTTLCTRPTEPLESP